MMKRWWKKIITMTICLMLALGTVLSTGVTKTAAELPSDWAGDVVDVAIEAKLVPQHLQQNYSSAVSRGNVAQMFINLIEQSTGQSINTFMDAKGVSVNHQAFTDTTDQAVLAANALGIIYGVGDSRFDPNGTLTRAQVAAVVNRVARLLGIDTAGYTHNFIDVKGHWVDAELGWLTYERIVEGVGNNRFNPDGPLTTEQAIAITYRAFQAYMAPSPAESSSDGNELPAPKIIEQSSFEGSWGGFTPNYGGSDIYLDPTAQDGNYSLRFTFPTGFQGGDAPDIVSSMFPAEDEVYIQFYFKLSADFQWHPITQKLIYFRCGQSQLNDTNHLLSVGYWENGVSMVTQHNTGAGNQEYHWGNVNQITKDVWHKIVIRVVMNTPGKYDGIVQVWFDDLLAIDQSDILWLVNADHGGVYEFQFTPVFGGLGSSVAQTMYIYFDNLIIQDGPFESR